MNETFWLHIEYILLHFHSIFIYFLPTFSHKQICPAQRVEYSVNKQPAWDVMLILAWTLSIGSVAAQCQHKNSFVKILTLLSADF